jgi:hypothetical protein
MHGCPKGGSGSLFLGTSSPRWCCGDCDENRKVSVDELVSAVHEAMTAYDTE